MQVKAAILICLVATQTVKGWWLWDNEDNSEEKKDNQEQLPETKKEEDVVEESVIVNTHTGFNKHEQEADEVNEAPKLVTTLEHVKQMDKEAFEKKLEEVIKAHEELHLSKETHFDPNGEHNDEFDHEVEVHKNNNECYVMK